MSGSRAQILGEPQPGPAWFVRNPTAFLEIDC